MKKLFCRRHGELRVLVPLLIRVLSTYGVVTVSRIDKIIGLFCKRDL